MEPVDIGQRRRSDLTLQRPLTWYSLQTVISSCSEFSFVVGPKFFESEAIGNSIKSRSRRRSLSTSSETRSVDPNPVAPRVRHVGLLH
jgi:hypothetical protein